MERVNGEVQWRTRWRVSMERSNGKTQWRVLIKSSIENSMEAQLSTDLIGCPNNPSKNSDGGELPQSRIVVGTWSVFQILSLFFSLYLITLILFLVLFIVSARGSRIAVRFKSFENNFDSQLKLSNLLNFLLEQLEPLKVSKLVDLIRLLIN